MKQEVKLGTMADPMAWLKDGKKKAADSMPKVFRTKWRKKGCWTCKPVEVAYPAQ